MSTNLHGEFQANPHKVLGVFDVNLRASPEPTFRLLFSPICVILPNTDAVSEYDVGTVAILLDEVAFQFVSFGDRCVLYHVSEALVI